VVKRTTLTEVLKVAAIVWALAWSIGGPIGLVLILLIPAPCR
jgi:hypothetical protein